jgi:hypothetical protein
VLLFSERVEFLGFRIRRVGKTGDLRPVLCVLRRPVRILLLTGSGWPVEPPAISEIHIFGIHTADVDGLEDELEQTDPGVGFADPNIDLVLSGLTAELEIADGGDPGQIRQRRIPGNVHLLRFLVDQIGEEAGTKEGVGCDQIEDLEDQRCDPDSDRPFPNQDRARGGPLAGLFSHHGPPVPIVRSV